MERVRTLICLILLPNSDKEAAQVLFVYLNAVIASNSIWFQTTSQIWSTRSNPYPSTTMVAKPSTCD